MKVEIIANALRRHVAAHSTTARCLDCDDRPARLARPSSPGDSVGRGFSTALIRRAYSGETELVRSRAQLDLAMTLANAPGGLADRMPAAGSAAPRWSVGRNGALQGNWEAWFRSLGSFGEGTGEQRRRLRRASRPAGESARGTAPRGRRSIA
jgi:hypothetical protein